MPRRIMTPLAGTKPRDADRPAAAWERRDGARGRLALRTARDAGGVATRGRRPAECRGVCHHLGA